MTDEAWPHGRHLSLSWFWLVWHHGAIHWSMVHGKEVLLVPCLSPDLSNVHQLSCCPSSYVSIYISRSSEPQRGRLIFPHFKTSQGHIPSMHKHLAEQQVSEVGRDLCWHTSHKSHRHVHSDELCSSCQDWKETSWYFGPGCSGLPPVTDCSSWFLLFNLREQMSPYYAALLTCITDVGTFLNKVYLRSLLARAGYWVWYFLGTERIASISLKTFVLFRTKFQYVIISSTSVSL